MRGDIVAALQAEVSDRLTSAVVEVIKPCINAGEPTDVGTDVAGQAMWDCAEPGLVKLAADRGWDLTTLRTYAQTLIERMLAEIEAEDTKGEGTKVAILDDDLSRMHATFADAGMYSGVPLKDRVRMVMEASIEQLKAEVEREPDSVRGHLKLVLAKLFQAQLDAKQLVDDAIAIAESESPNWPAVREAILAVDRHIEVAIAAQQSLGKTFADHPAVLYGMAQVKERMQKLRAVVPVAALEDYAPGVTDVVARVRFGSRHIRSMSGGALERFYADVETVKRQARLHEISRTDATDAIAHLKVAIESLDDKIHEHRIELRRLDREIARLQVIAGSYHRGPSALVALEQQLLALRINHTLFHANPREVAGALQAHTLVGLKRAEPYCWSPEPVEAVTAAAALLPGDTRPNVSALGELAAPAACGWWWFDTPIPVQTTAVAEDPVVALLWKREVDPTRGTRTWFSTFVAETAVRYGRTIVYATPSSSWAWWDDETLAQMSAATRTEYQRIEAAGQFGFDVAPPEAIEQSEAWFSRFWLAAGLWLQQRIVAKEPARLPRQQARAMAREYQRELPTVQIVNLRRRAQAATPAEPTGREVHWSCRWVVSGFWRNQFYPSRNEHAPKWIDSFIKGPSDAPLKTATRIYQVKR